MDVWYYLIHREHISGDFGLFNCEYADWKLALVMMLQVSQDPEYDDLDLPVACVTILVLHTDDCKLGAAKNNIKQLFSVISK